MSNEEYKYVFGPVPSRRLGRSLGVDLVPFKVCTYDCLYCQLGFTTDKRSARGEFVPLDSVLTDIKRKLISGTKPDFITLSGSGEPTLYSRLDELITGIRHLTDTKIAVITNSSLLWDEDVRKGLLKADLVVPSLDAGDAETFALINRQRPEIGFEKMVDGLIAFAQEFTGELWLEVFLLKGVNDSEIQVMKIKEFADIINPDKIQLNTVARPTADKAACAVAKEDMERFAGILGERAEVIADYSRENQTHEQTVTEADVLDTISRHPCSVDDIASGLNIRRNEALKYIEHLLNTGKVEAEDIDGKTYYKSL